MPIQKTTILLFALFFKMQSYAQLNTQLCKPTEEIIFTFQVKNQKWVSVCKEKNGKYLVYRFGKQNKIELQYPAILDSNSWNQFTFKGYTRGGGKGNAAMHYAFLNFNKNGINYEVYETWDSEDDKEKCGVFVRVKNTFDMMGNLKSRKGNLLELLYEDKIKVEEEK